MYRLDGQDYNLLRSKVLYLHTVLRFNKLPAALVANPLLKLWPLKSSTYGKPALAAQVLRMALTLPERIDFSFAQEKDNLNGLLRKEKTERVQLEKLHHQMHMAYTKAETEIAGLNQRLTDKQSGIDGIRRQLEQAKCSLNTIKSQQPTAH